MLSFKKDEPPFHWEKITSVRDDWHLQWKFRNSKTGEPPKKRRKTKSSESESEWPFNWDWNGLFMHDIDFLALPDTVLLEVAKMVDNEDRMQLSFTCAKMRRMILKNKKPEMDRRVTVDYVLLCLSHRISLKFINTGHHQHNPFAAPPESFDNLDTFLEYMHRFRNLFHCKQVNILILEPWDPLLSFTEIVKAFEQRTADHVEARCRTYPTLPSLLGEQMLDAFLNVPNLDFVGFLYRHVPPRWNEYRTTVTEWAESKGMGVKRDVGWNSFRNENGWDSHEDKYGWYFFDKQCEEEKKIIVIGG